MPVSTADVFRHQVKQQQGTALRAAEELLEEVTTLVSRLRAGNVPTVALNVSTVGRVLTDHATLVALKDALEVASKTGEP